MLEKIIIAGFGGQGIMLLGKVLAEAAMREGRHVTFLPSYGAEVRGGTAYCMVVISDREIGSPFIGQADTLIIMNGPAQQKFKDRIKRNGLCLLNSSFVSRDVLKDIRVLKYPFTDIAVKLGNIKVANMVALGCLAAQRKTVRLDTLSEAVKAFAPKAKQELISINLQALREGAKLK